MVNVNYAVSSFVKYCALLTILLLGNNSYSQCSLACNGTTQVSLDVNCEAVITSDMILNDGATSCGGNTFEVVVMDHYNNVIPTSPMVTSDYCDQTLVVKVIAFPSGNTCWGEIVVEDKLGPVITSCPTLPVEYACSAFVDFDGPIFTDGCSGVVEPILLSETVTPLNCDDDFIKQVVRTYTAVDNKGNYAPECTITYNLRRIDLGLPGEPFAGCPQEYTVYGDNALNCGGTFDAGQTGGLILDTDTNNDGVLDADLIWDDNGNGYPDVEEFEGPSLDGVPLYPNPDFYCNSGVFFDDLVLPTIGCATKIMRTWYIREWWCGQELEKTCTQVFEIVDEEEPVLLCEGPITITTNVTTNPHDSNYGVVNCGAEIVFPLPSVTDNCAENFHFDLEYPGGFTNNYEAGTYISLPMGENIVTVTVYDECYNSASCPILVNVVDNTPPVAICDEYTAVALTNNGLAHVFAETFDDGSYDDCQLKKMLVRRMDPSNCDCSYPHYNDMTYVGEYDSRHYYVAHYPVQLFLADQMAESMGGYVATMGMSDTLEGQWIKTEVKKVHADEYVLYRNGEWVVINPNGYVGVPVPGTKYNYVYEVEDPCTFSSYTEFCCADVGADHLVVFRVVDVYGNYNDCMVTVEVQDKVAPTVVCPPDMTFDCDYVFDYNNLGLYFGEASFSGSCVVTPDETYIDNIDQCTQGEIKRIFTATNANGIESKCEQIITFVNPDPFTEDQIIYPRDTTDYVGCFDVVNYHPDVIGYPIFLGDQCDLVGANYEDQTFTFNNQPDQGCFKILRTWTVIDWCQRDYYGNFISWTHTQIIKVGNANAPTLSCNPDPITVCTYDPNCASGEVTIVISAQDDCTSNENLKWEYIVDLDCDGTWDPVYDVYKGTGPVADATGDFPIGTHCILFTFSDQCGNKRTCTQEFTVVNCKAPTPYCINGLAVDLMPLDTDGDGEIDWGMVELWASDFDAGSHHPCGNTVTLSFSSDPTETNMIFDCTTQGDVDVEIWASITLPDGTLIQSYCETFVNVQDNNNACPDGGTGGNTGGGTDGQTDVIVEGRITTELEDKVEDVVVNLDGSAMAPYMTDGDGNYAFPAMPMGGDYIVNPSKNTEPLNGVTTLDLVLIQRHILSLEKLDSPYKIIAGNINKDDKLSSIDLIQLRKLILGITEDFPENESWIFVDRNYQFIDAQNPLFSPYPEVYDIDELESDMVIDFVGVKVGDVNNTVTSSLQSGTIESREANQVEFSIKGSEFSYGPDQLINIYAQDNIETYGFQFTLALDESIELLDIYSEDLGIGEQNFGFTNMNNGLVTVSWNQNELTSIKAGTKILTLKANINSDKDPMSMINLNSEVTTAEIYGDNFNVQTPVIVLDGKQGNEITYTFELFQNSPNPFTGATEIGFTLPTASEGRFTVTDVSGKVLYTITDSFVKGMNALKLDQSMIPGSAGILYYTLDTKEYTATRKMVVLR